MKRKVIIISVVLLVGINFYSLSKKFSYWEGSSLNDLMRLNTATAECFPYSVDLGPEIVYLEGYFTDGINTHPLEEWIDEDGCECFSREDIQDCDVTDNPTDNCTSYWASTTTCG